MAPEAHAPLGPSGASRWMNCPASLLMEKQFPDRSSADADKGTLAHAIAELKARFYFGKPNLIPMKDYRAELKTLKQDPRYEKDMAAHTDMYLDCLKSLAMSFPGPPGFIAIEEKFSAAEWAQDCWGTADCVLAGSGKLCVIDYKNGVTPVSPEHNPQLMIYALAALSSLRLTYGDSLKEISLTIVQPKAGGIKTWELSSDELLKWGDEVLRPGAALALSGEGNAHPDPDPNGWCKFCRARHACKARAEMLLKLTPSTDTDPKLLTDSELGDLLRKGASLKTWYDGLKEYALSAALSGRKITGYKVVEGRGSREWKESTDKAFEALRERGVEDAMLWERKPVSVAALEKALGKKGFASTAKGLWEKKPGKPALVEEEDSRPTYNAARVVFTEVK